MRANGGYSATNGSNVAALLIASYLVDRSVGLIGVLSNPGHMDRVSQLHERVYGVRF